MASFDALFDDYLLEQQRAAVGQRLEMLKKDLTGTKKLLEVTVWPVFKSLEGIVLEYEFVSSSGVRIYLDAYCERLRLGLECDGFVAHGELLTRDRFTFERMRVRSTVLQGIRYAPFSYDEMDKKPEACQRFMYELLGRFGSSPGSQLLTLPLYEREVLRLGWAKGAPFTLMDICACLQVQDDTARKVAKRMMEAELLAPVGSGTKRFHMYRLTSKAERYLI